MRDGLPCTRAATTLAFPPKPSHTCHRYESPDRAATRRVEAARGTELLPVTSAVELHPPQPAPTHSRWRLKMRAQAMPTRDDQACGALLHTASSDESHLRDASHSAH